MAENQTPNQRIEPGQDQSWTQNPMLRRPPMAGGPRRIPEEPVARPAPKKSLFKKALPYLIAGGSTGFGVGYAINSFLLN